MKKVVSATLAGALAVGMVPAMALADDDAVELLATTADVLNQGDITAVTVNGVAADASGEIVFTAGKDALGNIKTYDVVPTEITPYKGAAVKVADAVTSPVYSFVKVSATGAYDNTTYKWLPAGVKVDTCAAPGEPGTYYAVVSGTNGTDPVEVAQQFVIKPASIEGVVLYEKNPADDKDFSDTTLNYTGAPLSTGLALDGVKLAWSTDVTFFLIKDGVNVGTTFEDPGAYTLRLTGKGIYTGTVDIPVTVGKFDVNALAYDIADIEDASWAAPDLTKVIGLADSIKGDLQLVKKSTPTLLGDPGSYTYTLKAKADTTPGEYSSKIAGEQDITFAVYENTISDFQYNNAPIAAATNVIDLSDKADLVKLFDASKVKVYDGAGKEIDSALYDIVVTDISNPAMPKAASVADVNTPGKWKVEVVVDPVASAYKMGGSSAAVIYDVTAGLVGAATTYVTFDGEVFGDTAKNVDYTGDDMLALVDVEVKTLGGKVLTEGSDYTVEVKNGGKVVTEAVNAGTYTITIKSASYDLNAAGNEYTYSVDLKINQRALKARMVEMGNFDADAGVSELPYTGEAIVPTFEYWVNAGADKVADNADDVWKPLPAEFYTLAITKDGKAVELKKVGDYTATLTLTDAGAKNFTGNWVGWPQITDYKKFQDVPNGKWFFDEVMVVTELGWMKGYGVGSTEASFFGPYDTLKRGDAAVSIFRFAGHTLDADDGQISKIEGYDTDFSDVDAMKYWAEAILWASKSGIMTGYTGTDEFGPADALTRQQMVTVLWRYAELTGADMTADAAALAAYADADEVAGYAAEAMAWAVSNKIIGVDTVALNPANDVTRAEFAAMLVRFDALLKA